MSQKVNEKQNPRAVVTANQNVKPPEIMGLSPDDPIGVDSDGTGKPPEPPPPPLKP